MIEFIKSQGIKHFMNNNPKINRFAEVLEIKLKQGKADLTIKLKGETEPVNISLDYAFEENTICITNVITSKEWINALAEVFKKKYSRVKLSDLGIAEGGLKASLFKLLL
ncbi:MAG: hypothetical protein LBC87_11125 [Fibromonadaceae bacterium]|nr:hypothetical protein [Fibromonadaceae bacterium]